MNATSARDTDWFVHLVDVAPDGYSEMLCEGLMRARHRDPARNGAFNPDKLNTIDFWPATGNAVAKGHRIRVEIMSSYFPLSLPNLNSGADNIGLETTTVAAQQKIFHSAKNPSHIVLPLIPRR